MNNRIQKEITGTHSTPSQDEIKKKNRHNTIQYTKTKINKIDVMFLPDQTAMNEKRMADERRKQAFRNIETWSLELIPPAIRDAAIISAQEFNCNDPDCSPVDTSVSIMFQR